MSILTTVLYTKTGDPVFYEQSEYNLQISNGNDKDLVYQKLNLLPSGHLAIDFLPTEIGIYKIQIYLYSTPLLAKSFEIDIKDSIKTALSDYQISIKNKDSIIRMINLDVLEDEMKKSDQLVERLLSEPLEVNPITIQARRRDRKFSTPDQDHKSQVVSTINRRNVTPLPLKKMQTLEEKITTDNTNTENKEEMISPRKLIKKFRTGMSRRKSNIEEKVEKVSPRPVPNTAREPRTLQTPESHVRRVSHTERVTSIPSPSPTLRNSNIIGDFLPHAESSDEKEKSNYEKSDYSRVMSDNNNTLPKPIRDQFLIISKINYVYNSQQEVRETLLKITRHFIENTKSFTLQSSSGEILRLLLTIYVIYYSISKILIQNTHNIQSPILQAKFNNSYSFFTAKTGVVLELYKQVEKDKLTTEVIGKLHTMIEETKEMLRQIIQDFKR